MYYNGLQTDLGSITKLSNAKSFSVSPENLTGEKGKGAMAEKGTGELCARELGKGWKISPSINISPNETFVLADIKDMGAITSMWFGGVVDRNYILRIYWDNNENASVECPLPDFFASAYMKSVYNDWNTGPHFALESLPVVIAPNRGMNCFWQMPFRQRCLITIENRDDKDFICYYQINYTITDIPQDAAYFHAQFRQVKPLLKGDTYTIVDNVQGPGHYVGTAINIGLNGDGNWWGEGELKFFMDGDTTDPTICYTGTEDYVGGSFNWDVDGQYVTYSTSYMGMHYYQKPDGLYRIQPRFSMYRWHIPDPIRFQNDLRVTMQDLGWKKGRIYLARRDDISTVAYWYQMLPFNKFPDLPDKQALEIV